MWVGNLMLLIINLPLIGLWVKLLQVPYRLLYPAIVLFCCIGMYSIGNKPEDVLFTALFGLIGYALYQLAFEPAPMLLGFVLGRLLEEKLRQALIISGGSATTFVSSPLSIGLLLIALLAFILALLPAVSARRRNSVSGVTRSTRVGLIFEFNIRCIWTYARAVECMLCATAGAMADQVAVVTSLCRFRKPERE